MSLALLLEDEPLIAMDVEMALEDVGYDVTTVASCSDAHVWLDNNRPEVAIIDIQLQDGSSDSVAARFVDQDIPFIVYSGDLASEFDGTVFAHGTWLPKPSGSQELEQAIKSAMLRPSSPPLP